MTPGEAVEIVAAHTIATAARAATLRYGRVPSIPPELSAEDWEAVCGRIEAMAPEIPADRVAAAYALLAEQAEEEVS